MTRLSRRYANTVATAAVIGLAALTALTACSGGDGGDSPQVAALPATSAHPGAAAPHPAAGTTTGSAAPSGSAHSDIDRTLPVGATQAQEDRLDAAWHACWKAEGIPRTHWTGDDGLMLTRKNFEAGLRKDLTAKFAACDYLEPKQAPQLDPKTNPDYWDELAKQVRCVRAKGYDVVVDRANGPGLGLEKSAVALMGQPKFEHDIRVCEVKAFAP